jgi:hypothetical protein
MRRYTGADLAALFEYADLDVVAVDHYGFPFAYLLETSAQHRRQTTARSSGRPGDARARTAGSGRCSRRPWAGGLIWWATAPLWVLQRRFLDRGQARSAAPAGPRESCTGPPSDARHRWRLGRVW